MNDLSVLGVLDLDWERDRWTAICPTLTRLPGLASYGLLCGARPALLIEMLHQSTLDIVSIEQPPAWQGLPLPDTVVVQFDDATELQFAAEMVGGDHFDALAEFLAMALPTADPGVPAAGPNTAGAPLERYDVSLDQFTTVSTVARSDGTYRQKVHGRWRHWVLRSGAWRHIDRGEGVFLDWARSGESPFSWRPYREDPSTGTLLVKSGHDLPIAQARAAVLCSGFLPIRARQSYTTEFDNVPFSVADRIARSLNHQLQSL